MTMEDAQILEETKPPVKEQNQEDDGAKFDKSLQELRGLCSQLNQAADFCEKSFMESKQRQMLLENTKEYICRVVVTVVDHLGSVSSNLNRCLSTAESYSKADFRINTLNQRMETCQEYCNKLALSKMCWRADFPVLHPRYISPPPVTNLGRQQNADSRSCSSLGIASSIRNDKLFETEEEVPLFIYTSNHKPFGLESCPSIKIHGDTTHSNAAPVLAVRDGLSSASKAQSPSFQLLEPRKLKRNILRWKPIHHTDIISLIKRGKR